MGYFEAVQKVMQQVYYRKIGVMNKSNALFLNYAKKTDVQAFFCHFRDSKQMCVNGLPTRHSGLHRNNDCGLENMSNYVYLGLLNV